MEVSVDKIVQMDQTRQRLDNMKNPFVNWLAMKPSGLNYDRYVIFQQSEHVDNSDLNYMDTSTSSSNNSVLDSLQPQSTGYMYLVVSSRLIFSAFLIFCVAILLVFERIARRKCENVKDIPMEESENDSMEIIETDI